VKLIEHILSNAQKGMDNGYRKCCIAWFSLVWNPLLSDLEPIRYRYHKAIWRRIPIGYAPTQVQYIPCPLCLLRKSFDYDPEAPAFTAKELEEMMDEEDYDDPLLYPPGDFH